MVTSYTKSIPIEILSDDVFLVSYPKSGRTWMRFLICNYLTDNKCDFTNSYLRVPGIDYNPEQCSQIERPRFIQSHWPFVSNFNRVVYLVRDGRDVAVSYYFHMMKFRVINKETSFRDFVLKFNDGSLDGLTPWSNHVDSWLNNAPTDFLLVRYEDMILSTSKELIRVLNFAGLPVQPNRVTAAVEASKFEKMKHLESSGKLYEELAKTDSDIPHVRQGKIGAYKDFFDCELMMDFIKTHGSTLRRLGYLHDETNENVAGEMRENPHSSKAGLGNSQPTHQLKAEVVENKNQQLRVKNGNVVEVNNLKNEHKIFDVEEIAKGSSINTTVNLKINNIQLLLADAEINSQIPTKFPERFNHFPFNLSIQLQKSALKLHGFLFRKQRTVNMALIQALRESLEVNHQLIEQITDLQSQMNQSSQINPREPR